MACTACQSEGGREGWMQDRHLGCTTDPLRIARRGEKRISKDDCGAADCSGIVDTCKLQTAATATGKQNSAAFKSFVIT